MAKKPVKEPKATERSDPIKPSPLSLNIISSKYLLAIAIGLVFLIVIIYLRQGAETAIVTTTTTSPATTPTTQPTTTTTLATTTTVPAAAGRLTISMGSEGNTIAGGSVAHQMEFTITGIDIYNEEGGEGGETGKWVDLSVEPITVALVNNTENVTVAEVDVENGNYEKIKLKMSDGSIWITNDLFYIYTPKRYDLVVPAQTVVNHAFSIESQPLTLILSLDVRSSTSRTGVEYTLGPVITVVTT